MIMSQGGLEILFSKPLVSAITVLALSFLFWPLIALSLRKLRGG